MVLSKCCQMHNFPFFKFSLRLPAVELIVTVVTDGVHRDQRGPGYQTFAQSAN